MKSSCHFFQHIGMPTQFSDSNSPVSLLHGTNLYSLIFTIHFHWPSLSVSWQQIYNNFTLDKSSNHALRLYRPTSTTNFPWPFLSANSLTAILGTFTHSCGTDIHHRKHVTWPLLLCDVTANHRNIMSRDVTSLRITYIETALRGYRGSISTVLSRRACPPGSCPPMPWAYPSPYNKGKKVRLSL
jgi:hypothetical protein